MGWRAIIVLAFLGAAAWPDPAAALVGGTATGRELPHMVAMEFSSDGGKQWTFRCGGSLVAPDVVLTAAHCVSGEAEDGPDVFPAANFRFLVGTKRRSSGGERITVTEVREDDRYDSSGELGAYDVALLKLSRTTTLGRAIRLARTDEAAFYAAGKDALVTGWGANAAFGLGAPSDDLEEITVPVRSDDECQSTSVFEYDPATMMCAGNTQGGEDSCQGDSGGPLMVTGSDGGFVLVGAVSFGFGCAFPTQYGIYAELAGAAMRGWIEQNVDQLSAAGGRSSATSITQPGGPQPAPPGTTPSDPGSSGAAPLAAPKRVRITLPVLLGSARLALRTGRLRVVVRSSERLRDVLVTLKRGSRTVATGQAGTLRGRRTISLRVRRRSLRAGTATLRVLAHDASGRVVRVSRRVRIRR